jgi:hypothetical protein
MHHQDRHGDLLQVFTEVGLGEGDDAVIMRIGASHHPLAPPIPDHPLRGFRTRPVIAIERSSRHIVIELGSVGSELRLKPVKNLLGQPTGIGRRLYHQRRHRADDHCFCYSTFAITRQVMHHFAAAGRMADMHRTLKVEMCRQCRQVVGVMIHVMAVAGLGGAAMATPVVGDHAEAVAEEEQHLRVPIIGRQRPAVAKHDGLTFAPVFIVNLRYSKSACRLWS